MNRLISIILAIMLIIIPTGCKRGTYSEDDSVVLSSEQHKGDKGKTNIPADTVHTDKNTESSLNQETSDINENTEMGQLDNNSGNTNDLTQDDVRDNSTEAEENNGIGTIISVDIDGVSTTPEAAMNSYYASDCFIGKIVDVDNVTIRDDVKKEFFSTDLPDEEKDDHYFRLNPDFFGVVYPLNAELYIYTVEIEKSIFSIFTEQGTKIKVIADVSDMTEAYKINQKYLMKGTLYEYEGETLLNLLDQFRARVNDDGTLIGLSKDAGIFDTIKNVEEFENNSNIKSIFRKQISIPPEFATACGMSKQERITDEKNRAILEKVIVDGKKAIIADSGFKMNLERKDEVK